MAVLTGGIILALLITFGAFVKYSSSRQYAAKKLNKVLLAREFSSSLATLAAHQLKVRELKNNSSKLVEHVSRPLGKMESQVLQPIEFAPELKPVIEKLRDANTELRDLSFKVSWVLLKDDFQTCLPAYAREKTGKIRMPIQISYKAPGSEDKIDEEYLYAIEFKAVANFIPVLSKFSLYIQDALNGESEDRFNMVMTDAYGNLNTGSFRPWVLNNGGTDTVPNRFVDAVSSLRGIVYLGGNRVVLGVARGWNVPGKYSEGFHLLAEGRGDGLYTTGYVGTMALLNWETGLCNTDPNDDASVFWYDLIKSGYADMSRKNSAFRLMGTDTERSPTIVFGNVMSRTLCARAFRESSEHFGPLPYTHSQEQYEDYIENDLGEEFNISYFYNQIKLHSGPLSRSEYNARYASSIVEEPYNRALGYMITNFKNPRPLESGVIAASDPLADFISGKAVIKGLAHKVPAPFSSIFPDIADLKSIDAFLKKMEVPGRRAVATIALKPGEDIVAVLKRHDFLKNGQLDLNGWIYVTATERIVINEPLALLSHGGIVVNQGNIEIKNSIKTLPGDFLLSLVALNGNVTVDSSVSDELDVSLIASGDSPDTGQVRFAGNSSSTVARIKGNIAMRRLPGSNFDSYAARGLELNYRTALAALPGQAADTGSEKSLLMFSVNTDPKLVD